MNIKPKFYQSVLWVAFVTGLLLLIPLMAMQFSSGVEWTFSDFMAAGGLLFGTGFIYILVTQIIAIKMGGNIVYRVAIGFALLSGLFLIWSNLAVGLIGSENRAINLLYFIVIAVGLIGTFIVRFQPKGMTLVMFTMAGTHALIAAIALILGMQQLPHSSVVEILSVNGFFIVLFVLAALLFRYAAEEQTTANNLSKEVD